MHYLKIINYFWKKKAWSRMSEKLKNDIQISVGHAVL